MTASKLAEAAAPVAVVGPTAIGKTAVALELVRQLGGAAEILSVDSVQVYRRLDVGSAKPTRQEREAAAFHLLDLVEPDEPFTLADYQEAADAARRDLLSRGRRAILCGGTGLYFRSLTQPLGLPRVAPDEPFRAALAAEEQERGPGTLHRRLLERDPLAAGRIHPNDTKRLIRALEVIHTIGSPLSDVHAADQLAADPLIGGVRGFALNCDRDLLYDRINQRVDAMLRAGFLDEVHSLRASGFSPVLRPMRTVGYRELNAYLDGDSAYEDAVEAIKRHTRQFARRQLIWFRADPRLAWIDAPPHRPPADVAQEILAAISS